MSEQNVNESGTSQGSGATGTVEYTADYAAVCDEALGYTVRDTNGEEVTGGQLLQGYTVTDIPADEVARFLLNQNFSPADSLAEDQAERIKEFTARRINGTELEALAEPEPEGETTEEATEAQPRGQRVPHRAPGRAPLPEESKAGESPTDDSGEDDEDDEGEAEGGNS